MGRLRRLGRVLHVSPSGKLIVESFNIPVLHDTVYDNKLNPIGYVYDIIGPISKPYISVEVTKGNPEKYVNKILYISYINRKHRKRKKA